MPKLTQLNTAIVSIDGKQRFQRKHLYIKKKKKHYRKYSNDKLTSIASSTDVVFWLASRLLAAVGLSTVDTALRTALVDLPDGGGTGWGDVRSSTEKSFISDSSKSPVTLVDKSFAFESRPALAAPASEAPTADNAPSFFWADLTFFDVFSVRGGGVTESESLWLPRSSKSGDLLAEL
jgi:hypothetical protein